MIRFHRFVATVALLAAPAVFATGEKIALVPDSNPLRDTLCISMDCVGAGEAADLTVATRAVKAGVEITVTTASGQRRLTQVASATPEGQISSTELVKLTSAVLKVIEQPASAPVAEATRSPAPVKPAAHAKARPHLKLVARR